VRLKALRNAAPAAFLATAIFSAATYIVEQLGWDDPLGLTQQAIFFVIFFLGMLWAGKV
jgi:hypothetical protein